MANEDEDIAEDEETPTEEDNANEEDIDVTKGRANCLGHQKQAAQVPSRTCGVW
jgi:hypothetical protein